MRRFAPGLWPAVPGVCPHAEPSPANHSRDRSVPAGSATDGQARLIGRISRRCSATAHRREHARRDRRHLRHVLSPVPRPDGTTLMISSVRRIRRTPIS